MPIKSESVIINYYIFNSQMRSSTSPFRGRSYVGNTPESMEVVIKNLERQNNGLVEEINLLRNKNKKVSELQSKIEMILKHNNQLLNQNQRLARLINQKKSELDHWKSKYDDLNINRATASDIETKRLLSQIDKLKEDIVEMEHLKNKQMGEVKNQYHLQIQNIRRSGLNKAQEYELQIRKLKQYCEKKEYEITQFSTKLVRISKESQFQISKLRQEKERLKTQLNYEANEHRREVEGLRNKFDYNFHSEIENLKKVHLSQMENADYENTRLKEIINAKAHQIQQMSIKNNKVKDNYEDSLSSAHHQIDDLKRKIIDIEQISEIELTRLRDKMEGIKESELGLMRSAHSQQCDLFNEQIRRIKEIINDRNNDLQVLAQERNQMRIQLEAEILRVKTELQMQLEQNTQILGRHQQEIKRLDEDYKHKNEQMKNMESHLRKQIQILRQDNENLSKSYQDKKEQLGKERSEAEENERMLKTQLSVFKEKATSLKDQNERMALKSTSDSDDLKRTYDLKVNQLESRIQNQQKQIDQFNKLVRQLKDNIENKDNEIKLSEEKIDLLQNYEKELRRQAEDADSRWNTKEVQFNSLLREQIRNMDNTRQKQCEELGDIHQNKINSMRHQLTEMEREIDGKSRLINDLKGRYEDLVNKFEEVFSQRAAQKNLDIKVPGWLPDTLATKSLFDVFLKNKVLEYCS